MPDRVREAVFDMIGAWAGQPGTVPPCRVADMFAGSGSMGLEALSRGAAACDFFEKGKLAVATLKGNLNSLNAGDSATIIRLDAWSVCLTTPRPNPPYGLIFLDPPYADARDTSPRSRVCTMLNDLYRASWATVDTTIVLHHEDDVVFTPTERSPWRVFDRRSYGSTAISFIDHRDAP